MKKIVSLLIVLTLLLSLFSCGDRRVSHCELSITLPSSFTDYDTGGIYDVAVSDGSIIVGILRLSFEACIRDSIPITMDAEKFAKYYKGQGGTGLGEVSEIITSEDVVYFTYILDGNDGGKYFYMPTFYVSPYAYFVVTFITDYNFREAAKGDILNYSSTVYININNIA